MHPQVSKQFNAVSTDIRAGMVRVGTMHRQLRNRNRETAASETIGSVMLISVVVMAIAIVGVALTSQPAPTKIPAVSAVISESGKVVQLYHDGGDRIERSEMVIYVDGTDQTRNFTDSSESSGWTSWSVGETLKYTAASGTPKAVEIVYRTGSGGASVLASTDFTMGNPKIPTASPTPGPSTITASAGSGGSISPSGSVSVVYGGSQSFTITPNTGYSVSGVLVDGVSQGAITSYTFTNVVTGHSIAATFVANTNTITASAGTGGTITPSGAVSVSYGSSQSFAIAANPGYNITDVVVDSASQGPISGYTFTNVVAAHTITATFTQKSYAITSSAGTGGSISPSGTTTVTYGGSQTYTIANTTGYYISAVTVDGASQGAITSYTFSNVQAAHIISATFAPLSYSILSSAGTGGSISPSGTTTVMYGGSQTYTIANTTGYYISAVTVDGASAGAITSYTFSNVQATHSISATFSPLSYTITSSAEAGGSISPSGTTTVTYGGSQTYTITNTTGYDRSVTVDGLYQGGISSYTFTNVNAGHTIVATFPTWSAPTITSFSPPNGNRGSFYTITITGTNFRSTPTVTLIKTTNSAITQTPTVTSSTGNTIICTITLATGTSYRTSNYYVRVTNPDGQYATASSTFYEN
jgi:hypothetical protein